MSFRQDEGGGEEESIHDDIYTIPDYKSELNDAKTYLQRISPYTGDNMYDHLSDCLNKMLAERPENVVDFFEEFSRKMKEERFRPLTDHLQDQFITPLRHGFSMKVMPYLKAPKITEEEPSTEDPEDEDPTDPNRRNLLQHLFYFEKVGIGLPKQELFYIELTIKRLRKVEKLVDIRFWGKIFGLYKNYLVVEAELNEEEIERRNTPLEEEEGLEELMPPDDLAKDLEEIQRRQEEYGEGGPAKKTAYPRPLPPVPVSQYVPPPEAPVEMSGEGVNKKVYYVCNEPGDEWIQLPNVTPQQIAVARQVVVHFTGNLDQEIITYPKFDGTERNYLRAQLARISAGTQISPLGYYTFRGGGGGDEEEEEEEEVEEEEGAGPVMKTKYNINKRYDPPPMRDLIDISMSFWVHHTLNILPQGRTKWWNPKPKPEGGEEEVAEEEMEEEAGDYPEPETGPPLLTPLSEDASLEAVPAWSVRCSTTLFPEHAVAIVRSNLWPGAYAFTCGKLYENIYVGTGHKHFASNFSPLPLPPICEEYPLGPEIMEATDPTAQQEEDWRIAHEPKPKIPGEEEGEEEAEEEEEEDEDE